MIKKRVKVILTGGTIAGNVANSKVKSDTTSFGSIFGEAVEIVKQTWEIEIEHSFVELFNLDSSNMNTSHWKQLALAVKKNYDETDAYIIVHGTNTMGYTAATIQLRSRPWLKNLCQQYFWL